MPVSTGGEITLNMDEVDFVPPERPKPPYIDEPERKSVLTLAVPRNLTDVEIVSLSSAETENTPTNSHDDSLTATSHDIDDRQQRLESCQVTKQAVQPAAVETFPRETDVSVSDRNHDVVSTASEASTVNSTVGSETDRQYDHDMGALPDSVGLFAYSVGNLQETVIQSEGEGDVDARPVLSETSVSDDSTNITAVTSPLRQQQSVAAEEVTAVDQLSTGAAERLSPSTAPVEPVSFRVSEKDVRRKRDELASTGQPTFDTAWQSSGDGGRFRIRSIAKHVSYTEVFGDDLEPRASSREGDSELPENFKRATGFTTDSQPVHEAVTAMRDSEHCSREETEVTAVQTKNRQDVTDGGTNSQRRQVENKTVQQAANVRQKPELGSSEGRSESDRNVKREKTDRSDKRGDKRQSINGETDASQNAPSSLPNVSRQESDAEVHQCVSIASDAVAMETVSDGDDKTADNRKGTSSSVAVEPDKSDVSTQDGINLRDAGKENRTDRQPETIVIDKSTLFCVGGQNRRAFRASREPSDAKLTAGTSQRINGAAKTSATLDRNALQQSSQLRNVSEETPGQGLDKSSIDTRHAAASGPAESRCRPMVAQRRTNQHSTVVRVVNGCIVDECSSAASVPAANTPRDGSVTVDHCEQSANDVSSSQHETVTDDSAAKNTNSLLPPTPVCTEETAVDYQPSMAERFDQLHTPGARKHFFGSEIPSASVTANSDFNTRTEDRLEPAEVVATERCRVTSKIMPQTAMQSTVYDELQVTGTPKMTKLQLHAASKAGNFDNDDRETLPTIAQRAVKAPVGGTQEQSAAVFRSVAFPKPPVFDRSMSVPAEDASTTASSTAEEKRCSLLAHVRSRLRPAYRPVAFEVHPNDGGSAASSFVLRSSSSSSSAAAARRNYPARDDKDGNLLEHKPTSVEVGSKTAGNATVANQSNENSSSGTATVGTGSTSRVRSSRSMYVGENSQQRSAPSSPTSDEVSAASTTIFSTKPKPRSRPDTVMTADSRVLETENRDKGIMPPSDRLTTTLSQDGVANSAASCESSPVSGVVNLAAVAMASLHPAKPLSRPHPPPKLTVHEQLMMAIRDAGGSVPTSAHTVPDRCKSASALPDNEAPNSSVSVCRPVLHEPTSLSAPATDRTTGNAPVSFAVNAAKKSRVTEPPKLTPHEQMMVAIRNAGGVRTNKATDATRSRDSTMSFSTCAPSTGLSSASTGTAAEPFTNSSPISANCSLTHHVGPSQPSADKRAPPTPGPPPPAAITSSSVAPEAPKPAPRKSAPAASWKTTRTSPQPVDTREALMADIRDAAGGKGLRKVSNESNAFGFIFICSDLRFDVVGWAP